jgi:FKBP-type peptidyl-prolyl cis-trans isomerase FkpA
MFQTKTILQAAAICGLTTIAIIGCKTGGFQKLTPGIEYQLFEKGKGSAITDSTFVKMHIIQKAGDSTFVNTFTQPGEPVLQFLTKDLGKGEGAMNYTEVFFKMKQGDSVVIRLNQDSVFKANKPAFLKKTDQVLVIIKMAEIMNAKFKDSILAEQGKMAAMQQQMQQEQQKKSMEKAAKIAPVEDAKIQSYLKANNIVGAQKTGSGLYIALNTVGTGAKPAQGQEVTMNYTGMMLDGTKFDSNVDPAFNHVQPFTFKLGMGQVIPGWDEGIAQMPVGSKGVLLIPSYMAYGENSPQGSKIKPNSILRFDVEVVSAK